MTFQGLNELNTIAVNRRWSRKNTKRPNLARLLAVFLGVLCAALLADYDKANAMNLSLFTPDGAGVTVKIPLRNFKPVKSDTEIHFYALQNRQRMVSVETPLHGRFMRVKMAELKFIKRFKNGQPKSIRPKFTVAAGSNSIGDTKPLYRKAKFKLGAAAVRTANTPDPSLQRGAAYATASLEPMPRKRVSKAASKSPGKMTLKRARKIATDYVNKYNALRDRYTRLAKQNPRAARKIHASVMKMYRVAAQWQAYLSAIR